jgi:integrase
VDTPKGQLKVLRGHFGKKLLSAITYGDCKAYRDTRFRTPTRTDIARHARELKDNPNAELRSTRAIASVNRELALLRAMLNTAVHQQWIARNPFNAGAPLINASTEVKREVVLSRDEERLLLEACDERQRTYKRKGKEVTVQDARRVHLKGFLIALFDTGCRRGELLKLEWEDVDFNLGVLHIRAFNTKTQRERYVPMSARLKEELLKRYEASPKSGTVFGLTDVKKSFDAARKEAGLEHVRLHDIRHTAATRLTQANVPLTDVSRYLGHTNVQTTFRYINPDTSSLELIRSVIDNPAWAGAEQPAQDAVERVN